MCEFVKCFDVVSSVVDEATKRFSLKVNEENYDILQQYCEYIDCLAEEFYGESFDVEVDEIKMTIAIRMECTSMLIKTKEHEYYSLAEQALSVGFSVTEDGNVCIEFVFPSVWERG